MLKRTTHTSDRPKSIFNRNDKRAPALMLPIFKSPLLLYRLGLGWILGRRFMLLTHVGRRSGKVHRTILAVLRFDPQTKEVMAISAWSASDWYLNIQATPALEVETGLTRYVPQQRVLSPEEIAILFEEYRQKHPIFSRIVCQIPSWKWDSSHEEFLELARTLRGVTFKPAKVSDRSKLAKEE